VCELIRFYADRFLSRNNAVEKEPPSGSCWECKRFQRGKPLGIDSPNVTPTIKLNTGQKTIKIETTDQKLSAHAWHATFLGFDHLRKFREVLDSVMPYVPSSPNALRHVAHQRGERV
jgi:hypothetical protein